MAFPLTPDLRNKIKGIANSYVKTFNKRRGDVTLTSADVINALGYTPGSGGISGAGSGGILDMGYRVVSDGIINLGNRV